jgi:hypothetical protein
MQVNKTGLLLVLSIALLLGHSEALEEFQTDNDPQSSTDSHSHSKLRVITKVKNLINENTNLFVRKIAQKMKKNKKIVEENNEQIHIRNPIPNKSPLNVGNLEVWESNIVQNPRFFHLKENTQNIISPPKRTKFYFFENDEENLDDNFEEEDESPEYRKVTTRSFGFDKNIINKRNHNLIPFDEENNFDFGLIRQDDVIGDNFLDEIEIFDEQMIKKLTSPQIFDNNLKQQVGKKFWTKNLSHPSSKKISPGGIIQNFLPKKLDHLVSYEEEGENGGEVEEKNGHHLRKNFQNYKNHTKFVHHGVNTHQKWNFRGVNSTKHVKFDHSEELVDPMF